MSKTLSSSKVLSSSFSFRQVSCNFVLQLFNCFQALAQLTPSGVEVALVYLVNRLLSL